MTPYDTAILAPFILKMTPYFALSGNFLELTLNMISLFSNLKKTFCRFNNMTSLWLRNEKI